MTRRGLVLALLAVVLIASPVLAQDPTPLPSPTPTPLYMSSVPLPSGGELLIQRTVTYGDVAVVVAALVLWVTFLAYCFVRVPHLWK